MKRRIIIYIDNLSLAPFNRNRVFTQMKEFLKTAMRPGDEAMVATYNRSMKVRVPFTRDAQQVSSILDAIAGESGLGVANRSERKSFEDRIRDATSYEDAIASARTYASSVEHDLRQGVASLNALMSTLAGVEGKKILVLTSEGFPDAARPRDLRLRRRDRPREALEQHELVHVRGHALRRLEPDPVRRQNGQRQRHHALHDPRRRSGRQLRTCRRRTRDPPRVWCRTPP